MKVEGAKLFRRGYTRRFPVWLVAVLAPTICLGLYRGDEFAPRKYNVGSLYFINIMSYEYNWRTLDDFESIHTGYLGAGGSISGDDLYLYHNLKLAHPLGVGNEIRLQYLSHRDFCGVYDRFAMSFAHHVDENWSVELVGEPNADKEFADIGAALVFRGERHRLRTQVLIPNFVYNYKGNHGSRLQRVPNLQTQLRSSLPGSWRLVFDTDLDFPRHLTDKSDGFEFDFEKYKFDTSVIWDPDGASDLIFNLEGEFARKNRVGELMDDERDFSIDREYWQATVEYGRQLQGETLFRAGMSYVNFDEDKLMPNDIEKTLINNRNDHIAYAGRTWRMRDGIKLNTMMLGNILRDHRDSLDEDESSSGTPQFQARLLGSLIWYGSRHRVELGMAANLHQTRFGGGFTRIFLDF